MRRCPFGSIRLRVFTCTSFSFLSISWQEVGRQHTKPLERFAKGSRCNTITRKWPVFRLAVCVCVCVSVCVLGPSLDRCSHSHTHTHARTAASPCQKHWRPLPTCTSVATTKRDRCSRKRFCTPPPTPTHTHALRLSFFRKSASVTCHTSTSW